MPDSFEFFQFFIHPCPFQNLNHLVAIFVVMITTTASVFNKFCRLDCFLRQGSTWGVWFFLEGLFQPLCFFLELLCFCLSSLQCLFTPSFKPFLRDKMLTVHNIKKLDLEVLLVLFLLSLSFFHKSILGLAVNLAPHLPSLLGPLCPAQARVLRLRSRVLIREHCNYKNLGLISALSVQPEEEGTPGLLRLTWQFPFSFYDTSHGSDPLPDWSQGNLNSSILFPLLERALERELVWYEHKTGEI